MSKLNQTRWDQIGSYGYFSGAQELLVFLGWRSLVILFRLVARRFVALKVRRF